MRALPVRLFLFTLLLSAALSPHALGNSDQDNAANESAGAGSAEPAAQPEAEPLTVTGTIRLLGSEPFPELVLTDGEGNDWYLDGDAREKARTYQHQELTLRGRPEYKEMKLANGMSMGTRYFLRDAVIVE
jgi:hypothetical protein